MMIATHSALFANPTLLLAGTMTPPQGPQPAITTDQPNAATEPAVPIASDVLANSSLVAPPSSRNAITIKISRARRSERALIFVESTFGFGHFNIVDLLAKELLEQEIAVGVASSTFDHNGYSFDFGGAEKIYLPPLGINKRGILSTPDQQELKYHSEYSDLIYRRTQDTLAEYDPSLIIYELYPFMQPWRDATTRAVNHYYQANSRIPPERVALCRDIIHSKDPESVLKRLKTYCSRLMVRGDNRFSRLEDSQPEWGTIRLPIDYVGNFAAPPPQHVSNGGDVVIFGGGGYRGEKDHRFLESVVGVPQLTEAFKGKPFTIILGHGTPDNVVDRMLASVDSTVTMISPVESDAFKTMLAGAAAVITRAGYNTCFELVQMKKAFVVVPRRTDEQELRATQLERGGYGHVVHESGLSAETLAKALDNTLIPTDKPPTTISFDGARRMARALADLLRGSRDTEAEPLAGHLQAAPE